MLWNSKNVLAVLASALAIGLLVGSGHTQESQKTKGQAIANELMEQWKRANPDRDWVTEEKERHKIVPPADNSGLLKGGQREGDAYGKYTEKDILIWSRELEKFVVEGSRIFHDAELLSSTIAVSCDMCHPDGANTHPETYPKFQVQMGRVVLLRDMINWCIEQAVRGEVLAADDPRMRALEAYMLAQRKGVKLNYGKR
jgi:thiosulfate dehydrogenase